MGVELTKYTLVDFLVDIDIPTDGRTDPFKCLLLL